MTEQPQCHRCQAPMIWTTIKIPVKDQTGMWRYANHQEHGQGFQVSQVCACAVDPCHDTAGETLEYVLKARLKAQEGKA